MALATGDNVPVLVMDVESLLLIVPVAMVDEVIPFQVPEAVAGQPGIQLGQIKWREQTIPVLMWTAQNEPNEQPQSVGRIVVFHALPGDQDERRFALRVFANPEPKVVSRLDLQIDNNPENVDPMVEMFCILDGLPVAIPDFSVWHKAIASCKTSSDTSVDKAPD